HVVPNRGSVLLQTEVIGNIDIARLQHVDRPRIHRSLALLLGSLIFDDLLNVGTPGHPYSGERAAHQYLVGMNTIPAVFVLVIETRRPKSGPSLLEGDVLHPIENLVG